MNTEDNDTLYEEQQNTNQPMAETSKNKDALIAKLLAGAAMAAGTGAAYAAGRYSGARSSAEPEPEKAEAQEAVEEQPAAEQSPAAEPTVEERLAALEEKERLREMQEQERQQTKNEVKQPQKPEDNPVEEVEEKHLTAESFFEDHDVKVQSVGECTLEDGSTVNVYFGTIDGHQAAFMDDGQGHMVSAVIDENDNGNPDDDEIIDLRPYGMTDQHLAEHCVEPANPEIEVIGVEHDVSLNENLVDVAAVRVDGEVVYLVDADQDGVADLALADANHDDSIDDSEVTNISEANVVMPTGDDVSGSEVACNDEGMTDYSNDADVDIYDV